MRVRPFSWGAYVLRGVWDGVPLLMWLAYCLWLYRKLAALLQIQPELLVPFVLLACWMTMYGLRPIRKFLMLRSYQFMLRVPIRAVAELGIWKLLLVHDRYWPADLPDYFATVLFTAVYSSLTPSRAERLNKILWQVEFVGKPHLAKPARGFLREVNAPLREDV